MSSASHLRFSPWFSFACGLLLTCLIPLKSQAQEGIVIKFPLPPAQYANLPSNEGLKDPAVTGSLPGYSRSTDHGSAGFGTSLTRGALTFRETAPTGCLPGELRGVLADVAEKFGPVSIESTHRSTSRNRRAGGAGHSLHLACRAVDFRLHARARGVMAYLSSRSDVGGLKMYRNGIIHIDNGSRRSW